MNELLEVEDMKRGMQLVFFGEKRGRNLMPLEEEPKSAWLQQNRGLFDFHLCISAI